MEPTPFNKLLDLNEKWKTNRNPKEVSEEFNQYQKQIVPITVCSAIDLMKKSFPPIVYDVENFIVKASNITWTGLPGDGKSLLLLATLLQANDNQRVFGHFPAVNKFKTVWYDADMNGDEEFARRLHMLCKGLHISESSVDVEYRGRFRDFETELKYIKEKKFNLVVIDSLLGIFEGDENSSTDIEDMFQRFYFKLKEFKITSITLDHLKKGKSDSIIYRSRGSSNKGAKFDFAWQISQDKDSEIIDEDTRIREFDVCFEVGKDRSGAVAREFSIHIVKNDKSQETKIQWLGFTNVAKKKANDSAAKVLEYLNGKNECKKKDIVASLQSQFGYYEDTIKKALDRLVADRKIDSPKYGFYKIRQEQLTLDRHEQRINEATS